MLYIFTDPLCISYANQAGEVMREKPGPSCPLLRQDVWLVPFAFSRQSALSEKRKKKEKKKGNGRALRGELLCMDGWSSSWPSSLIGWRYISRTPPVHLKENTASVHTMMHSVWSGVQFDLRAKMEVSGEGWWRKNCGNSAVSPTTPWIHKAKQKPFFERRAWLHLTFNW